MAGTNRLVRTFPVWSVMTGTATASTTGWRVRKPAPGSVLPWAAWPVNSPELGLLAVPGLGPVVAAGWLASPAAVAAAGGAAGGIIGALSQSGVTEDDAQVYAEENSARRHTCIGRVPEAERRRYEAILHRLEVALREREADYRSAGWTRYDPAAPAYTAEEIRGERERFRSRV